MVVVFVWCVCAVVVFVLVFVFVVCVCVVVHLWVWVLCECGVIWVHLFGATVLCAMADLPAEPCLVCCDLMTC